MPGSPDLDKPFVRCCGVGEFLERYLEGIKPFKDVAKFGVLVAIPVIFASPISKDDVGTVDIETFPRYAHQSPSSRTRTEDTKPRKNGCRRCGAATTKASNSLLKCAKCKTAQYCSPDCQKKDWRKHKQTCKQVQEKGVGDDAA